MVIRFEIDPDKLTFGDMLLLEDVQDGKRPFHGMRDLMAPHMVGEDGAPLTGEQARAVLAMLTLTQTTQVIQQFSEALKAKALPPVRNAS